MYIMVDISDVNRPIFVNCRFEVGLRVHLHQPCYWKEAMDPILKSVNLLEVYKQEVPVTFDTDLIQLCKSKMIEFEQKIEKSHMRPRFAANAFCGNYLRCEIENEIFTLAEDYGMDAGMFRTNGGSEHVKVISGKVVLTVHTLGDIDGSKSRITKYKKSRASKYNNINSKVAQSLDDYGHQKSFLVDDDIGKPKIIDTQDYTDDRFYYMIHIPRLLNKKKEFRLVAPSSIYDLDYIFDTDYLQLRSNEAIIVDIYAQNSVTPTTISIKGNDVNEIHPKLIDTGDEKAEGDS